MGFDPEVLNGLGINMRQLEAIHVAHTVPTKQNGVCVCGHPSGAHTENVPWGRSAVHDKARDEGAKICVPSKSHCPCPEYHQVLTTADVRLFHYKTSGPANLHALSKGVQAATSRRLWVRWEDHLKCFKKGCKNCLEDDLLGFVVVALDKFYSESPRPTDMNVLLCEACRIETKEIIAPDIAMVRVVRNEAMQWSAK